jgi:hypothetical protein
MSSNASRRLLFFPTPYPDEILYSVLCRYHSRSGKPSILQTNLELWGKRYGKRLYLPDDIGNIANEIPESAGLTAERLIHENTIFPWLKPFLPEKRGENLLNALTHGHSGTYNIAGFPKALSQQPRCLRYCHRCVEHDVNHCGEAYWHRVHQLPGVQVCPAHNVLTIESDLQQSDLIFEYSDLTKMLKDTEQQFDVNATTKLAALAKDALWLLQNGSSLGYLERTTALYDRWFRVQGYRESNGKTSLKRLAKEHINYYGKELLESFGAYNSGACSWLPRIIQFNQRFQNPLLHTLLMRTLAGSVEEFYAGAPGEIPVYKPYGEPPYPCRNAVCEFYLQDVIGDIDVISFNGKYRATFECPHCGLRYRRKTPIPKEKQYAGQIDITDYGWLWYEILNKMLSAQASINKISRTLKCDSRTVVRLGIELGFFPQEQEPKRSPYIAHPKEEVSFDDQRDHYRKRWKDAVASSPSATRNELRLMDSKTHQWLCMNDKDWYESNSPMSRLGFPEWVDDDSEYANRIENAMKQIRDSPGKPKRVSIQALGKTAGIPKIYKILASGRMPMMKAVTEACADTLEEWQYRKIRWAVGQMVERGEVITVYKVRHRATIADKERKLDEFIAGCIAELL